MPRRVPLRSTLAAGLLSACGGAPPSAPGPAPLPVLSPLVAPPAPPAPLEPGCLGLRPDASAGVFVVETQTPEGRVREVRFVDLLGQRGSFPLGTCPSGAGEAECRATFAAFSEAFLTSPLFWNWRAARPLVACAGVDADAGGGLVAPLGEGLRVASTPTRVQVASGDRARELWSADDRDDPEDTSTWRAAAGYWPAVAGTGTPNLFVELRRTPSGGPDAVEFAVVPGAALGLAPCATRPKSSVGLTVPVVEPAPFDPAEPGDDCLAATPDGRHAAFLMHRSDMFDQTESGAVREVRWFGPAPLPTTDLGCLADTCTPAQRKALEKAGLVTCPRVEGAARVDGHTVPLVEGAGALWLVLPDGPRWVRDIAMSAHDGGDHESFEAIFQTGATLPAFLYFTNADTGLSENRVTVVDDAAAGLCPR